MIWDPPSLEYLKNKFTILGISDADQLREAGCWTRWLQFFFFFVYWEFCLEKTSPVCEKSFLVTEPLWLLLERDMEPSKSATIFIFWCSETDSPECETGTQHASNSRKWKLPHDLLKRGREYRARQEACGSVNNYWKLHGCFKEGDLKIEVLLKPACDWMPDGFK